MNSPRLYIGFITDGEPFHGGSPEEQALGGSETAMVQVARALAARGHKVAVYCRCPRPGTYHGVDYHDRSRLVGAAGAERFDVLVVSRFFTALDLPLEAGLRVLWNHDILDKPSSLAKRLDQVDICLVLSRFHAGNYALSLPSCAPKLVTTRNGLDLDLIRAARSGVARDWNKATYVSRPERGLGLLLDKIWPRLKKAMPELRLEVCGYEVSGTDLHPRLQREYAEIGRLVSTSQDVMKKGALAKHEYYGHLASCGILLYPCIFPEISCISVLEAQALGTPLVTSDDFALRESVLDRRYLVSGRAGSPEYVESYISRVCELMENREATSAMAEEVARKVHVRYDWSLVAEEWETLFLERLEEKVRENTIAVAAGLLLRGGRMAASGLMKRELTIPDEGLSPSDPDEKTLLNTMARALSETLDEVSEAAGTVGVISADEGRTARALGALMKNVRIVELPEGDSPAPEMDVVLIRDRLEREERPQDLLNRALAWCRPQGYLALCVASGAWPLVMPGHLARHHDLGKEDILALLPGRRVAMNFLPRALVGKAADSFFAGRLLALTAAVGPGLGQVDLAAAVRRTRPAPREYVEEVKRAGLL